ncbi:hypothetical protein [Belliella aquatica]|uniref:TolB-like 6-blade propeller-like n=1 Tax=Belliella aquatica TaxID=1323734 RepID=A0ABQ1M709_9BACT|nr:hypothetical protein [Belliella aquatica]MCH7404750.1 hypothetical protein [Belliella aquatica]GGC34420.1 hypothetical protein GCM10010993_11660 [Belliella aquatica]
MFKSKESNPFCLSILSFFIITSLSFTLLNCTEDKASFQQFNEEVPIYGEFVKEISIFSQSNVNLMVVDSFLVIQTRQDNVLKVYNTNNFQLLVEYGTIGNGDLQFGTPELLKNYRRTTNKNSPIISVYDLDRREINEIDLLGLINDEPQFHNQNPIDDRDNYYLNFYYSSEEYYIGVPDGSKKFILFDRIGKNEIIFPYTPKLDFEIEPVWMYSIYRPAIAVNKGKKRIAAATMLIPNLEISDFEQNLIASVSYDTVDSLKNGLEVYRKSEWFDSKHFIKDIDSNNDYILGLNYNNSSTAIYNNYDHQDLNFLQFDWEGNLLKKFILADNKFVESFAVDFDNNKVYCFLPHEKEYNLYVYDLN